MKWVPPEWLSKAISVTGCLRDKNISVDSLKCLDETIIRNLKRNNIEYFFPGTFYLSYCIEYKILFISIKLLNEFNLNFP